ncbi:bacteriophage spanin2 family protein [Actinosynnema sp. NPDC053489]|uniref:bacteriophage spanin2 family protein n=1 Tax=Actinosynnema sp. NPDC053489 TaxID=3363916 RepID=UPI0037CAAE70
MRATTRFAAVFTSLAAVAALSACGTLQDASQAAGAVANTASTVQLCTEALAQATTVFDTASPERAVEQAHTAADRLGSLAADAGDTTVNEAVGALATTLRQVTLDDLVLRPAAWLQDKAARVADLTNACTP